MSVTELAQRARVAARTLATATRAVKDDALIAMADALVTRTDEIVRANGLDVAAAREQGTSESIIDRLALTPARL
ncbi:MAG: gamma-glutamyl-phosphate reductase, partial [Hamadaea sp.]|nr:gamma-glutamyl-phosphate reductase [Hamadaea sp.]